MIRAQDDGGVGARRARCRPPAGEAADQREDERGDGKGHEIVSAKTEQQGRQRPRQPQARERPGHNANQYQDPHPSEHELQNRRRPSRRARAEFPVPPVGCEPNTT